MTPALSYKYSSVQHTLSREHLHRLLVNHPVLTITRRERDLIEQSVLERRGEDGHISLRQIYDTLFALRQQHQISPNDFASALRLFEEYFATIEH